MRSLVLLLYVSAVLLVVAQAQDFTSFVDVDSMNVAASGDMAAKWANQNLYLVTANGHDLDPPQASRMISVIDICIYDAASYFEPRMLPIIARDLAPKPAIADANQAISAIAFSAYRCIKNMWSNPFWKNSTEGLARTDALFTSMGFTRADQLADNSAAGIGNRAADAVIAWFNADGSNAVGTQRSSATNQPYSTTSGFIPINDAPATTSEVQCSALRSVNHWVPLRVPLAGFGEVDNGSTTIQTFGGEAGVTYTPLVLKNAAEFRPPPPPLRGTNTEQEWIANFTEVQQLQSVLNDTMKAIAEFWGERLETFLPPGHLQEFAMFMAMKKNLSIFDSAKLLALHGVAIHDAGIASWEAKRFYQAARPVSVIQCLFQNQTVQAWQGPYKGVGPINGSRWIPYQLQMFNTPPFPEYVSGHSTYAGSSAEAFRRFFGSDDLGFKWTWRQGASKLEPRITDPADPRFAAGVTDRANTGPASIGFAPGQDVTLGWATFTEAADQCGISRLYGGIHISAGNTQGMALGRKIGGRSYDYLSCLWAGRPYCQCEAIRLGMRSSS